MTPELLALSAGAAGTLHCLAITQRLTTWPDEIAHVVVGERLWRDRCSPFGPAFSGQRMPLPQYLYGLTQLWTRSLLLARTAASLFAGAAIGACVLLTAQLGGLTAGVVAALVLCSSRTLLGYWSCATYTSLNALLLFLGVWGTLHTLPWLIVLSGGLLFLSRVNLWPALLVYSWWLWHQPEWLLTLWLIPAIWFALDHRHWRILIYVAGLRWLGRLGGWSSVFDHEARPRETGAKGWWRLATLHRSWWLLAIPASLGMAADDVTGPFALLFGVLLLTNALRVHQHPRLLSPYLTCFLGLLAPLIAIGWTRLEVWPALGLLLVMNLASMTHPLWLAGRWPLREMLLAGHEIRALVDTSTTVGLWGNPMPPYLAGLDLPTGQIQSVFTGSGVWPRVQEVINGCDTFIHDCSRPDTVHLRQWRHLGTVTTYAPWIYAVYRRLPRHVIGREEF